MASVASAIDDTVTLSNGLEMPWLGLGTWRASDTEAERAVTAGLEVGYRHIDTAAMYGNEAGVGRAIRKGPVPRDQVFVTTKIWNDDIRAGASATLQALDRCLERLGLDHVELVLLHWPADGHEAAWRGLEQAYHAGKTRAIGVSNYLPEHLRSLLAGCEVAPVVNQIELHPYLVQPELVQLCRDHDIQPEAWSPLMQGRVGNEPAITRIAGALGRTPAQVVLRWHLQHRVVAIPKSVRRPRLEENARIFDFELSDEQMRTLDHLDQNHRFGPDPHNFAF